ncbi:hypothetical protein E2C01_096580 [Portunus trituberculatus]|uniref:Uncharacterized protein n=1 Tax=Portunus trituberculatus TaxID=210409 RepID=A0A5B7K3F8_PORTR|nr:hypothetical protein [Portunus trituberculatus]
MRKVADPGIMSGESGPEGLPGGPDIEREESARRRPSTGWRGRCVPPARPRNPRASRGEGDEQRGYVPIHTALKPSPTLTTFGTWPSASNLPTCYLHDSPLRAMSCWEEQNE